ncbi:hypothetical protein [Phycisphaera mikurensis]|uniref:Uncharacterized protein n=1 Tax=Phycisphaera mikurensis (strain NBRC 102666 / KCTC 22515 / FYK2301M01) TaxID=1142394 RepID=I0IB77_PHYMF|nr:hypothetical protein [Phycisphaera mikurensis]MBB6443013.1 hypothetical protein [Phycisphaera mikurensis]BAM02515.1 hypothetical protein PSMK_03560 [Phycisphaera mikurensis NBRC 102666]
MDAAPPAPDDDALAAFLEKAAAFLPRVSGRLVVDGPLGRVTVQGLGDTVRIDLARVPELEEVRGVFARPPGPERAAPDGAQRPAGSKRAAAGRAREHTRRVASAMDAAGLTVEVRVGGDPLAVVGYHAEPGIVTRALGLGKVDLSGRTAFKLARDLLA